MAVKLSRLRQRASVNSYLPLVGRSTRAAKRARRVGACSGPPTRKMLRIFRPPHKGEVKQARIISILVVLRDQPIEQPHAEADAPARHQRLLLAVLPGHAGDIEMRPRLALVDEALE